MGYSDSDSDNKDNKKVYDFSTIQHFAPARYVAVNFNFSIGYY